MANEAGLVVAVTMRDNASAQMQQFGRTTDQTRLRALELKTAVMGMATMFSYASSLLTQIDNPMAKSAASFLRTAGYALHTATAISFMLPQIRSLITGLRTLNVTLAVTRALSGPWGWVGLGVAAAAGGGLIGMNIAQNRGEQRTREFNRPLVINNNVQGTVITERELGEITRKAIVKNQDRNSTSGIR